MMHKTKWVLPIMAVMWAVCLLVAPPLIQGGAAHEPKDDYAMTELAPASAVLAIKGLEAAPVATNPGTAVTLVPVQHSSRAGLKPGRIAVTPARQWPEAAARVPIRPRMWSI
ncbi:hypothetical protein [Nevskia sp.]|uniref:hypothetical protein n=1 Tax=Nevskia sp. TaxID=1929292 RepID=UPI0025FAD1AA|nr:hypothetical protein [Nevskia sp.]